MFPFLTSPVLTEVQYATSDAGAFSIPPILVVVAVAFLGLLILSLIGRLGRPQPTVVVLNNPVAPFFFLVLAAVASVVFLLYLTR